MKKGLIVKRKYLRILTVVVLLLLCFSVVGASAASVTYKDARTKRTSYSLPSNLKSSYDKAINTFKGNLVVPSSFEPQSCIYCISGTNSSYHYFLLDYTAKNRLGGTVENSVFLLYDNSQGKAQFVSIGAPVYDLDVVSQANKFYFAAWDAQRTQSIHPNSAPKGDCMIEFYNIWDGKENQVTPAPTPTPTPTTPPKTTNAPTSVDREKVKGFVERCYNLILGRHSDEGGLNGWVDALVSGKRSASQIIHGFLTSEEFKNHNYSSDQIVEILYNTMMDRPSDAGGKANWINVLNTNGLNRVINGFCTSEEFQNICNEYGIKAGSVTVGQNDYKPAATPTPTPKATPESKPADREKIKAFVERCYSLILGRHSDEGGLNGWVDALANGSRNASEIISGFLDSEEFKNHNYDTPQIVEILYKTMMNRPSDAGGKQNWIEVMNSQGINAVINGFCTSEEFQKICNEYGIKAGTVSVKQNSKPQATSTSKPASKPADREKVKGFVDRCYRVILGRPADEGGLNGWVEALANGSRKASEIISGFMTSEEFKSHNYDTAQTVEILYNAMMGRPSDPEGKQNWIGVMNSKGLSEVIKGFRTSEEFKKICNEYGITP